MKWWRIRKVANAATWELMFFSVGLLAGVMLAAMLPGMLSRPVPIADASPVELADLALQQSMTTSSWWMVTITTIASAVGGASLYLIALTLREAKRSADAADKAVNVALASNLAARDIGQAQVRAYAVIASANLRTESDQALFVEFQFKNSGQTPARSVVTTATLALQYRVKGAWTDGLTVVDEKRPRSDVPSQEIRNAKIRIGWRNYAQMRDGWERNACRFTLSLSVGYQDVFGAAHEEVATYRIEIPASYTLAGYEPLFRQSAEFESTPMAEG
jgi:hypothetical protein